MVTEELVRSTEFVDFRNNLSATMVNFFQNDLREIFPFTDFKEMILFDGHECEKKNRNTIIYFIA